MKAESDFSWLKILSFFGAGLAAFFAFVNFGSGGILIQSGNGFNGVVTIISAIAWCVVAFLIYKNYQKKTIEVKMNEDNKTDSAKQ